MIAGYIYAAATVAMTACAHILFRKFSISFETGGKLLRFLRQFLNPVFLTGAILMACAPLFYFRALAYIGLSRSYSVTALNQIIIPVSGFLLFHEHAGARKLAGITLTVAGIVLWNL